MTRSSSATAQRGHADLATGTFLVLLCLFSVVAYALIIHLHKEPAMLSRLIMWCPGTAALVTCGLYRLPQTTLGWRWTTAHWLVLAYVVPLLYALPVYSATWATITGSLALTDYVTATAGQYGFASHPVLATALVGMPLLATVGMVSGLTWALGEEIGWRGFLLPRLVERIGFGWASLVTGLIWAVWHYPGLIWADYNAGTDPAYAIACFTGSVVAMSFMLSWLRLRTGSVWPCALLHASHNLFIQGVFDPLTANVAGSKLVTTEFGCGLTLTISVVAATALYKSPVKPRPIIDHGVL